MYQKDDGNLDRAVKRAIRECIEEGRSVDFLRKHGGEIMDILNFTLTNEQMKEIGFNEGMEQGELNMIRKMKEAGFPIEQLAAVTNRSKEEIEAV